MFYFNRCWRFIVQHTADVALKCFMWFEEVQHCVIYVCVEYIYIKLLFVEEMIQSYKARNYSRAHNYTFLLTLPRLISSLTDWSRFKVEWMNKSQYCNELHFIRFHTPAHLQMGVFISEWFALLMRCRYIVTVSHLIRVNNVSLINSLISLYLVCCVMINNSRKKVLKNCLVLHLNRSSQCTSVINMLWSDAGQSWAHHLLGLVTVAINERLRRCDHECSGTDQRWSHTLTSLHFLFLKQ